ncbi:MAG TPA: FAD/NAD(P)-binding protein [Glaciihabitans sp.]|jgi:uncharacterized NAD(P)/FAD-binding protein YdhS|nr:FAD/NAD(P)-binding protein [Glaciihabitans sp.]
MDTTTTRIAIIGTGPRGVAVALRLLDERPNRHGSVVVHLIDPAPGGAVWDPQQNTHLLMNSRGAQATVFADDSVSGVDGPSRGPSFITWCRTIAPTLPLSADMAAQAAALTEVGFASRAFFGHYMRWVVGTLASSSWVQVHPHSAIDLNESASGTQLITMNDADATVLEVDTVVLALGHLPMPATARQQELAAFADEHCLFYLAPQGADAASLEPIAAGQPVAVLGAGLNFYDVMALLTSGRGGTFVPDDDGSLRYKPSGREPILLIASGRGIPYMGRAEAPLPVTLSSQISERVNTWMMADGELSFSEEVWPALVEEMSQVWATAGGAGDFDINTMIDPYAAALAERTSPKPLTGTELSALLRDILQHDARSAAATPRGPATAVAETLAVLKDRVRSLVAAGAFDAQSVQDDLQGWFRSVGAFIAAGPPLRRVREAIALIDAGILRALGADARLSMDASTGTFLVATRELPDPLPVTAVIEARLPAEDARTTTDPLVSQLVGRGFARFATLSAVTSAPIVTEGLEVIRTTAVTLGKGTACRLVGADGEASARRFLIGLPVQPQEWNIANLPQPNRGDRTLTQAESIATQIDELTHSLSSCALQSASTA